MSWIQANVGNIVIVAALAAAVFAIVRGMVKRKRSGASCTGCAGCSGCSSCPGAKSGRAE